MLGLLAPANSPVEGILNAAATLFGPRLQKRNARAVAQASETLTQCFARCRQRRTMDNAADRSMSGRSRRWLPQASADPLSFYTCNPVELYVVLSVLEDDAIGLYPEVLYMLAEI